MLTKPRSKQEHTPHPTNTLPELIQNLTPMLSSFTVLCFTNLLLTAPTPFIANKSYILFSYRQYECYIADGANPYSL